MLSQWLYIGIFMLIAFSVPAIAVFLAGVLSPKRPNAIKNSTYECGIETIGPNWAQMRIQYYIFGLVFLIFDVETVFLYPWAVAYGRLGLFAVFEAILFIIILAAGLYYIWRKGALRWL